MSDNKRLNAGGMMDAQLAAVAARYTEESYWSRLRRMMEGLRAPRQSREYKAAMIEMQRLSAPLSAIMLPVIAMALLALLSSGDLGPDRAFETQIIDVDEVPDLQDPEDYEPPPEKPDIDIDIEIDSPNVDVASPIDQPKFSPQPQAFDAVLNIKSPVILRNIYGDTRNTGARGGLLSKGGGNPQTEAAVLRALRWLKLKQNADGSWSNNRIAMTGLAILTFLAHNEMPGDSEEFGETVQKGLEYLLSKQKADGKFEKGGGDNNDYSHPIATYALCEAFGMTINPSVKDAAEKALVPIIKGQHPTGGWTYNMNPNPGNDGKYRDDTSYMGWCAQALKAAKLAQIPADGLENAIKLAIKGFESNASPSGGGFGYTDPGVEGMTAVGTLCMQLLGAADRRAAKLGLDQMKAWKPSFAEKETNVGGHNNCPQYYYYYATQAKFHNEGSDKAGWKKWNDEMTVLYVAEQKITKKAIKDMKGKDCDVGWWENKDNHTDRPVMDTCLAALQLMVYYRYLPTSKEAAVKVEEEIAVTPTETGDIKLNVDI
ncbi:MAG: terpene cyclase/mutase family protein [Kiritimatiellaeota bacterium]|nr:terpene cyclase/mutase family protein [Kiritimatiellota bacterium]